MVPLATWIFSQLLPSMNASKEQLDLIIVREEKEQDEKEEKHQRMHNVFWQPSTAVILRVRVLIQHARPGGLRAFAGLVLSSQGELGGAPLGIGGCPFGNWERSLWELGYVPLGIGS